MRNKKISSNDTHGEVYKYLKHVPDNQRVRLNGKIIRNGTLPGGSHREVILIENNKVIHHKIQ